VNDAQPDPFQEQCDDAMVDYASGDYDAAIEKFDAILKEQPDHFDATQGLSMSWYRQGDFPRAIEMGHAAEKLNPHEQLVHTNLSLFYMKSGDKETAEHHGLQARIASWRGNMDAPAAGPAKDDDSELQIASDKPAPAPVPPLPDKFPDMPWKKNKPIAGGDASSE
jgi:tetratricopeptide (TPR) repeat protein